VLVSDFARLHIYRRATGERIQMDLGNMPQGLVKAHSALDKAVDNAYGYKGEPNDAARVAFLFGLYRNYLEHL
jgi:hypothetical protein